MGLFNNMFKAKKSKSYEFDGIKFIESEEMKNKKEELAKAMLYQATKLIELDKNESIPIEQRYTLIVTTLMAIEKMRIDLINEKLILTDKEYSEFKKLDSYKELLKSLRLESNNIRPPYVG